MSAASFQSVGEGRYAVAGDLGFDSVPRLYDSSLAELKETDDPTIDLAGVTHVDSAGLALVIEWVRWARNHGRRLHLIGIPEKLLALARISEAYALLDGVLPETR